ncbi:MAG TPA: hypothetical protein DDZ81_00620 [Acetobacteraceae bacterium]|nr:hypothetical protein [Acetobacteraceae bacterium]
MVRRRRLTWKVAGFSLGAVLVAGVTLLWTDRLDLSRMAATRLLDRFGLGPVGLTVSRLDLFGLRAHDISLYGGAIRVADLTLAYDPLRLAAGVVDEAGITGLQATMAAAGGDITVGGVPLRFATSPAGGSPIGGLRLNAIRIVEAHVAFDGPTGSLEATFSTDLALSGADIRKASFTVDLTVPVAGANQTMHIVAPELALSSPDGGGLRLGFDKLTVQPKDMPWTVDDLGGEILWRADQLMAKIDSGIVNSTLSPPSLVPLRISGDATMKGAQIDFAAHAIGEAPGGKGKINLDAEGRHDRASGIGRSSVTVAPVVFRVGGLQPQDLFPAIGNALSGLTGSAALSGAVTWRGATLSPALILRLADVAYAPEGARLSKIHGDIKLTGLWPVATAPGQVLNGTVEAGGMVPSNATLIFHLLPKPAMSVESMRMDFVGGQMTASPFVIDPTRPNFETVIGLRQIDLATVFKIINIDGLSGAGRVDGAIPLAVSSGKVVIRQGKLAASGPGVLQLRSDVLPKQITEAGESMGLALQALADFHYDTLAMDLAESPTGDGTITLRLQGRNPAVLDGRAFNLNIMLESKFDRLIDLVLRSMAVTQELLRRTTGSTQQ